MLHIGKMGKRKKGVGRHNDLSVLIASRSRLEISEVLTLSRIYAAPITPSEGRFLPSRGGGTGSKDRSRASRNT